MKRDCPMYTKQTNLKGVYFWNKMCSLKSLAMLKCERRTSLKIYFWAYHLMITSITKSLNIVAILTKNND